MRKGRDTQNCEYEPFAYRWSGWGEGSVGSVLGSLVLVDTPSKSSLEEVGETYNQETNVYEVAIMILPLRLFTGPF